MTDISYSVREDLWQHPIYKNWRCCISVVPNGETGAYRAFVSLSIDGYGNSKKEAIEDAHGNFKKHAKGLISELNGLVNE